MSIRVIEELKLYSISKNIYDTTPVLGCFIKFLDKEVLPISLQLNDTLLLNKAIKVCLVTGPIEDLVCNIITEADTRTIEQAVEHFQVNFQELFNQITYPMDSIENHNKTRL